MTKQKPKKAKLEKARGWDDIEEKFDTRSTFEGNEQKSQSFSSSSSLINTRKFFISEVTSMLYAYGDVRHPLKETASLVEEIVYNQMCRLLIVAAHVAETRCSPELGIEEFLYLLRRDHDKLSRFRKRMKFLDSRYASETTASDVKVEEINSDEENVDDVIASQKILEGRRLKICTAFLSCIDETGELENASRRIDYDDVKMKRLERAEQLTRDMSSDEYMEYVKCRQISFTSGNQKQKFRDWFNFEKLQLDVTPSKLGWECIEYLAQETLAELVDLALLVRSENISPLLPCEVEPDSRHLPLYASSSLIARAAIISTSQKEIESSLSDNDGKLKTAASKTHNRKLALTPAHIREAMRRFTFPTTKIFLSKAITVESKTAKTRLLCLP